MNKHSAQEAHMNKTNNFLPLTDLFLGGNVNILPGAGILHIECILNIAY